MCVRTALWLIAIAWVVWFAHVRITTPPAGAARADLASADDNAPILNVLDAALAPLSIPPALSAVPRKQVGSSWGETVLTAALLGDWSEDPASDHRQALTYITTRTNEAALDAVVELLAKPPGMARPARAGSSELGNVPAAGWLTWRPDWACAALLCRARYRASIQSDDERARADLFAAARIDHIARTPNPTGSSWWYVDSTFDATYHEIGCETRERPWPPKAACAMIALLSEELTLRVSTAMLNVIQFDQELEAVLDRYYTDDGAGNGWLVLSAANNIAAQMYITPASERSRGWNICSPLFYGRAKIRNLLEEIPQRYRVLDEMSWDAARQYCLADGLTPRGRPTVLMGPVADMAKGIPSYRFEQEFLRVAQRRALVVMLALAAHKHDHGHYPESLDLLAPAYVDAVPMDAHANAPFAYTVLPDGAYQLRPGGHEPRNHSWTTQSFQSLHYKDGPFMPCRAVRPIEQPTSDESGD